MASSNTHEKKKFPYKFVKLILILMIIASGIAFIARKLSTVTMQFVVEEPIFVTKDTSYVRGQYVEYPGTNVVLRWDLKSDPVLRKGDTMEVKLRRHELDYQLSNF